MWKLIVFFEILSYVQGRHVGIVNGSDAKEGEYPFIVSLREQLHHSCGASIINSRYALTAAHCVCNGDNPQNATIYSIQYGSIYADKTTNRSIQVSDIYCNKFGTDYHNDIAVIKLEKDIPNDYHWEPILLSRDFNDTEQKRGVILGWGLRSSDDTETSPVLQKEEVDIYPYDYCDSLFGAKTTICIGVQQYGGVCDADSGGPLISNNELIGVTSMGPVPCGTGPDYFARVSYFYDWIQEQLKL